MSNYVYLEPQDFLSTSPFQFIFHLHVVWFCCSWSYHGSVYLWEAIFI